MLKLGSNDQSILEMWTADNFELLPILEGQSFTEAFNAMYPSDENITDESDAIADDLKNEDVASSLSIMFVSKNLNKGVKDVALTTIPPGNDSRDWNYQTYYSQINIDKTFYIERHNFWHRVFFGLQYMAYSTSSWSTIVSEWKKIGNNDSYSYTRNPCYQMKARVKYRSTSHFTIYFEP